MGAAGLVGLGDGAPVPDAERVAAIRFSILDDAEACAAFGDAPRAALAELDTRAQLALRSNADNDCQAQLNRLRASLTALDTTRLEPRGGLAGLFDSRGKRLKAFRAAWTSAIPLASETATEITQRGRTIASRHQTLDDLWDQTREAVADLDAHIVAARAWLADGHTVDTAAPGTPSPVRDPGGEADHPTPSALLQSPEQASPVAPNLDGPALPAALTAPVVAQLHPLQARLDDLVAVRTSAVAILPVLRAIQNAEHGLPARLAGLPDAIEAWQREWRDALGLSGKRPRKVRPDPRRLNQARQALVDAIAGAETELAASIARRAELEKRGSRALAAGNRPRLDAAV